MLIVGMFFFWIAVMSGLCGSADAFSAHAYALHVVFYASLLIATLTFTVRLLRPGHLGDTTHEESAAAAVSPLVPVREPPPAPEPDTDAAGRALLIAGPRVMGVSCAELRARDSGLPMNVASVAGG